MLSTSVVSPETLIMGQEIGHSLVLFVTAGEQLSNRPFPSQISLFPPSYKKCLPYY